MVKSKFRSLLMHNETGICCAVIVMAIIIGTVNISFFRVDNLLDVLRSTSYYFIIAAPLTALMVCGELDLSFGGVCSIAGVICGICIVNLHMPMWAGILIALAVGLAAGLFKSLLVVKFNLPGFITTLGIQYALSALTLVISSGISITGFSNTFKLLGQSGPLPKLYWTIVIGLVIGVTMEIVLKRTKFGRKIYAVGGNKETARLAGIKVSQVRTIAHTLVAVAAALVGIFKASRFGSAQPDAGSGSELIIMAAVIIGGCGVEGGNGSVLGSFFGCLLISVINNGLVLMHVSSYWNNLIFGSILILALGIDVYRQKRANTVHNSKRRPKNETHSSNV